MTDIEKAWIIANREFFEECPFIFDFVKQKSILCFSIILFYRDLIPEAKIWKKKLMEKCYDFKLLQLNINAKVDIEIIEFQ